MNRSSLLNQFVLATASLAIASSGLLTGSAFASGSRDIGNLAQQLIADQPGASKVTQNTVELPESVRDAVLKDLSGRTQTEISKFRILQVSQQTWSDGCLGMSGSGVSCTQSTVPGWAVLVSNGKKFWVYRANETGSLVKWDEEASQTVTALRVSETASQQRVPKRTAQTATAITRQADNRAILSEGQSSMKSKGGFNLTLLQPSGNLTEAIARVSLKTKNGNSYSKEKFVGDYKYKIKQKAKFVKGVNPGDRVVVRLYDLSNRLIGFSEFECLAENAAVSLILSDKPTEYRVVRTVYGIDADDNGNIDPGTTVYNYFTRISETNPEKVTFLSSWQEINVSSFQVGGLPAPNSPSIYTSSFKTGQYAVVEQQMSVFSSDTSSILTSMPGKVSAIDIDDTSSYDLSQMVAKYEQTTASRSTTTSTQQTGTAISTTTTSTQQAGTATRTTTSTQQTGTGSSTTSTQQAGIGSSTTSTQQTGRISRATQVSFKDISGEYWARDYIAELVEKKVIEGYPDGYYRPDQPVNRSEFAAMLSRAFKKDRIRSVVTFKDVPTELWYYSFFQDAYEMGFMNVDANNAIKPEENVSRLEVITTLARGMNYSTSNSANSVLQIYSDAYAVPNDARALVAAATERGIVVNYPNVKLLKPRKEATRAEVAAILYQAMVSNGQAVNLSSPYLVEKFKEGGTVREAEGEGKTRLRRNCNQGIGNGSEGCDPGNSRPRNGSNDEGGRTPGDRPTPKKDQ